MAWDGVLVRFGEVGIKSAPVRRRMLDRLVTNLTDALLRDGVEGGVSRSGSRVWLEGPEPERIAASARRVFGAVSVSPARRTEATMEAMGQAAVDLALEKPWTSFAVRPRREGEHDFTSQDVGREVGSSVFVAAEAAGREVRVDLDRPDLEVFVEVRGHEAYVYREKLPGPGGLPMGTQGRVVALLSDTSSLLAAWLMMRRGCEVVPVHAGDTGSLPIEGVEALVRWGMPDEVELLPVCAGTTPKSALLAAAQQIARERRAAAVVTGDTLDSDLRSEGVVLRPLCGLDPEEAARWQAFAELPEVEGEPIFDDASGETVQSLLSLRRKVAL